jgi:hypothetical protein
VEPAARPSAVSALPGHLEAFKFNASSGPSFLSRLPGAQVQLRACVPPRCSCTLAFIKAPVPEALFPKSSVLSVFHASSNASTQPIVRADAQRQAATGPHFILGLARPAVVRRSTQTLGPAEYSPCHASCKASANGRAREPVHRHCWRWPPVLRRSAHGWFASPGHQWLLLVASSGAHRSQAVARRREHSAGPRARPPGVSAFIATACPTLRSSGRPKGGRRLTPSLAICSCLQ